MALAHNILVRGLNSIYRQAPYVKPGEQKDFVGYAQNFVNVLTVHHDCEEESFFIAVERMSGEVGVMEKNAQQHHEFHAGLEELQGYLNSVADGVETYDGNRIVKIIDGFGTLLAQHLAEEVQCLVELKRFGPDKMRGLADALKAEGQANLVGSYHTADKRTVSLIIITEKDWPLRRCGLCIPWARCNMGERDLGGFPSRSTRIKNTSHEGALLLACCMVEVCAL